MVPPCRIAILTEMFAFMTAEERRQRREEATMLGIIAAVLIVLWLLGFLAFHVTAGFIHILLVLAAIMFVLHLFRGRSAAV